MDAPAGRYQIRLGRPDALAMTTKSGRFARRTHLARAIELSHKVRTGAQHEQSREAKSPAGT
jgi:hypothetical protein